MASHRVVIALLHILTSTVGLLIGFLYYRYVGSGKKKFSIEFERFFAPP